MLYTLNLHNVKYQLYQNKIGGGKSTNQKLINELKWEGNFAQRKIQNQIASLVNSTKYVSIINLP